MYNPKKWLFLGILDAKAYIFLAKLNVLKNTKYFALSCFFILQSEKFGHISPQLS